jgi:hypothetical protein
MIKRFIISDSRQAQQFNYLQNLQKKIVIASYSELLIFILFFLISNFRWIACCF